MKCKPLVYYQMARLRDYRLTWATDLRGFVGTDLCAAFTRICAEESTNELGPTIFKNWTSECEALASPNV